MSGQALLVCAAQAPGTGSLIRGIVRDPTLVVAVDAGAGVLDACGVTPDLLIGDMDSIDPNLLDRLRRGGVETITHAAEKDLTDLELALHEVRRLKSAPVIVTGVTQGRIDHTLGAIGALGAFADLLPEIREPCLLAWVLSAGHRDSISLSGQGATVSVQALGGPARVSVAGCRWELDAEVLTPLEARGVSNRIACDACEVRVHEGTCLVSSPEVAGHPSAEPLAY